MTVLCEMTEGESSDSDMTHDTSQLGTSPHHSLPLLSEWLPAKIFYYARPRWMDGDQIQWPCYQSGTWHWPPMLQCGWEILDRYIQSIYHDHNCYKWTENILSLTLNFIFSSLLDCLGILLGSLGILLGSLGSLLGSLGKPSWIPWKPSWIPWEAFLDPWEAFMDPLGSLLGSLGSLLDSLGKTRMDDEQWLHGDQL